MSNLPSKFIQFGCWNNLNQKGCLRNVMNTLSSYLRNRDKSPDKPPEFLVVSGDNYYPEKETINDVKKKLYIKIC